MIDLSGKAAIVTGASRGIGAAAAAELAHCGASVLLLARSTAEIEANAAAIREAGGRAEAMSCDVSEFAEVAAAVERCKEAFGGVDILVNNAGVIDPVSHLGEIDPADWGRVLDINTKGVFYGMRATLPIMAAQESGVIVNISSGAATNALEGWSHYCASKAAALMLTRCAHKEYGPKGVRVVGLSPGTVATEMQRVIKASGVNPVSQLEWEDHIPPEWPARAIAYLCGPDADDLAGADFSLRPEESRRRVGLI
ncbi:MAG: SDR family oxidoreductase [Pseudomonadota bacterium]